MAREKIDIIIGNIIDEAEKFDAVVNSASDKLDPGLGFGSIDSEIHKAAGKKLALECKQNLPIEVGDAVVTDAYDLNCKKIIHAAGPWWSEDGVAEILLETTYLNVMQQAFEYGLRTLAIPSISTGYHHCPIEIAGKIAVNTVVDYLDAHEDDFDKVVFILGDSKQKEIYEREYSLKMGKSIGYLLLSLKLDSYEPKEIKTWIQKMIEMNFRDNMILYSTIKTILKFIPETTPESLIAKITQIDMLRDTLLKIINSKFKEMGLPIVVRNLLLKNGGKKMEFKVSVEKFDFTEITNFACEKLKDIGDEKVNDFVIPALQTVDDTLEDELKEKLIKNLVKNLEKGIIKEVEKMLAKNGLHVKVGEIKVEG